MTTIATDGRTIAADGQTTGAYVISGTAARKLEIGTNEKGEPAIFGLSGVPGAFQPLMEWVAGGRKGAPPAVEGENAWTLLIVDRGGVRVIDKCAPWPIEAELPYAIGSGREVAYGAMDAGARPAQAVDIACRRDTGTGGRCMVIDIREALGQPQLAAAAE